MSLSFSFLLRDLFAGLRFKLGLREGDQPPQRRYMALAILVEPITPAQVDDLAMDLDNTNIKEKPTILADTKDAPAAIERINLLANNITTFPS